MSAATSNGNDPAVSNPQDVVVDLDDVGNDISFRAVDAVDVLVEKLSVDIDVSPSGLASPLASLKRRKTANAGAEHFKPILKDVYASMPSGSVTAIVGSSGSGKTSVLNTLSHRISGGRLRTNGKIWYNGSPRLSSIRSAYVMQQDVLLPTLTVRETLRYAAELRLPPPTTAEERHEIVEDVILELGLKECANTRIGNNVHKGCSGGEKRRASLAVQMLANPSVLFLDEVTTGLDAATAFQLVRTLKSLAAKGRTIIVTIHQPRSEIWSLFDHVLLLAGGSPLYSGPSINCLPYFKQAGYEIPPFVNPAEFLIDLAAVDTRSPEVEASSTARVQGLREAWQTRSHGNIDKDNEKDQTSDSKESAGAKPNESNTETTVQHHSGLSHQIKILTQRTFKVTYRDPMGVAGLMFEATSMAVITGWIYLQLDGSLQGIRSKEGALYTAASLQGYLVLLYEVYRLTIDIQLFDREYGEGVISVPAFLISRRFARMFMEDIPVPLIYSVIFYFMAGFRPLASQFFVFFSIVMLSHYIAVTLATLCIAVSRDFAVASMIANVAFTLQSLGCG